MIDATNLLWSVYCDVAPDAKQAGVSLVMRECGDLRAPLASWQSGMLQKGLVRLAKNSIKAMKRSGGSLMLGCYVTPSNVLITVQDSGGGIDPELVKKMFGPFFRVDAVEAGSDLACMKKVFGEHDCGISVCVGLKEGTKVVARLPRWIEENQSVLLRDAPRSQRRFEQ